MGLAVVELSSLGHIKRLDELLRDVVWAENVILSYDEIEWNVDHVL
jgi:hypothetical protein